MGSFIFPYVPEDAPLHFGGAYVASLYTNRSKCIDVCTTRKVVIRSDLHSHPAWYAQQHTFLIGTWLYLLSTQNRTTFIHPSMTFIDSLQTFDKWQMTICMVGIPADQNSPKWRSHAISEILHIENRIVCCIETYLIHIYHMSRCSKCNWNRYIEGFCMWNVHFHISGLSPDIAYVILMIWPLMAIYFLILNYWLFSVQFSYHI